MGKKSEYLNYIEVHSIILIQVKYQPYHMTKNILISLLVSSLINADLLKYLMCLKWGFHEGHKTFD